MEKRNSPLEHWQPMEETRGLWCTCDSGVARCQSQHQCHFCQITMMLEAYCMGMVWLAAVSQICVIHEAMNGCENVKIH